MCGVLRIQKNMLPIYEPPFAEAIFGVSDFLLIASLGRTR